MDRYYYFSPELISGDELKAGYAFAKNLAKDNVEILTVCVNSVQNCDQFLEKIFTVTAVNKLRSYKTISDGSVTVQLKSPKGLKEYQNYGVILALHSSAEAISKLEGAIKVHTLVVVAEVPTNGMCAHLENWASEKEAQRLGSTTNI
ncbi:MAG: hypothetical protein LRY74_18030 [Shewanella xiamenensis]|nr:hypothetical protein [Shewanella xiamenensis]